MRARRASLREGIAWIALNDAPSDTIGLPHAEALEIISCQISTALLADLFGLDALDVAADVLRYRRPVATRREIEAAKEEVR